LLPNNPYALCPVDVVTREVHAFEDAPSSNAMASSTSGVPNFSSPSTGTIAQSLLPEEPKNNQQSGLKHPQQQASLQVAESSAKDNTPSASSPSSDVQDEVEAQLDVFRLPTQSSDEEDDSDPTDEVQQSRAEEPPEDLFRLPTPEPSSSEESDVEEEPASEAFAPDGKSAAQSISVEETPGVQVRQQGNPSRSKFLALEDTPESEAGSRAVPDAAEVGSSTGAALSSVAETENDSNNHDALVESQGADPERSQASARVRFSIENSTTGSPRLQSLRSDDTPDVQIYRKRNPASRRLAVEDTPDTASGTPAVRRASSPAALKRCDDDFCLTNTQEEMSNSDADNYPENVVCAICQTGNSPEEDPIILCDGPGNGVRCDLAVHTSCYSASVDLDDDGKEWRCELCEFLFHGGEGDVKCSLCDRADGALKRVDLNSWKHPRCPSQNVPNRRKRLRTKQQKRRADTAGNATAHDKSPLPSVQESHEESTRKKRRRDFYQKFIDAEAGIASDEDMDGDDGEEDDMLAIEEEEEEAASSFINDSSQLGYTQDELDQADPDAAANDDTVHRAVDAERERMRQFATPILNDRMRRRRNDSQWSGTPLSAPSSQKGLGNMHFIRSVLEHHRQGGNAEDIEEVYRQLEQEAAADENDQEETPASQPDGW
jgi:rubredoxin